MTIGDGVVLMLAITRLKWAILVWVQVAIGSIRIEIGKQ